MVIFQHTWNIYVHNNFLFLRFLFLFQHFSRVNLYIHLSMHAACCVYLRAIVCSSGVRQTFVYSDETDAEKKSHKKKIVLRASQFTMKISFKKYIFAQTERPASGWLHYNIFIYLFFAVAHSQEVRHLMRIMWLCVCVFSSYLNSCCFSFNFVCLPLLFLWR